MPETLTESTSGLGFESVGSSTLAATQVVPVSLLVGTARLVIERHLPLMWVAGEISNFSRAGSGHCYFGLKDESAQVRCVLFRHKAQLQDITLRDGMHVELRATATIYEARGEFQLVVEAVRLAGIGRLFEAYNRLKSRLEALGWFAAERKRPLPALPRCVGVVTSTAGAALQDVLTTLGRRFPAIPVIVYPTVVQGAGAAGRIAEAIGIANTRRECDVLIVCRGGGSIEDLWAFNEEATARAVLDSAIPVVSGVGHETDFTICDFVADVRAPTPTAAAALAVPDCRALLVHAAAMRHRLHRALERRLERAMQQVDDASRRLRHPARRLSEQRAMLQALAGRMHRNADRRLARDDACIERLQGRFTRLIVAPLPQLRSQPERAKRLAAAARSVLEAATRRMERAERSLVLLDPRAVLERGYAIVGDPSGRVTTSARALRVGQQVRIEFARDRADAIISAIDPEGAAGAARRD